MACRRAATDKFTNENETINILCIYRLYSFIKCIVISELLNMYARALFDASSNEVGSPLTLIAFELYKRGKLAIK